MTAHEMSLFDVEDVDVQPKVRDMIVAPTSTADVEEFAHRYHYTGIALKNTSIWRWGLWHGPVLHGVVTYNLPTRSVCEAVFGPEHYNRVWHMGRLIVANDSPRNSESRLIAGSLRAIAKQHPEVWGVLTYADATVGHIGTIYQATNAIYTGRGGKDFYFLDADGKRRPAYNRGRMVDAAHCAEYGWTRHQGQQKHRYLYVLGNKSERRHRMNLMRLPILPYPKAVSA